MIKKTPIQYPVGIEDLYISFMVSGSDTDGEIPTYEADIYSQTNITKLGIAGNSSTFEKWASNQLIVSITRNTKHTLTFDLAGLSQEVLDKMLDVQRKKGISIDTANPRELPTFAVGVVFPLNDGTKIARWYPRCKLTPAEESYQTLTEEMDIPDQQYVVEANPLLHNKATKVDFWDGDESNQTTSVTVEDFLSKVICDESQIEALGTEAAGGE